MLIKIVLLPFRLVRYFAGFVFGIFKTFFSSIFGIVRFIFGRAFGITIGALIGLLLGSKRVGIRFPWRKKKRDKQA